MNQQLEETSCQTLFSVMARNWDKLVSLLISRRRDLFSIAFRNWGEIRQGSPYNTYSATFTGRWKPNLRKFDLPVGSDHGWTNLYITSDDKRYHALVVWDFTNNRPGFHIVIFDTQKRSISVSERYLEFPHTLHWENDAFKIDHDIKIVPGRLKG